MALIQQMTPDLAEMFGAGALGGVFAVLAGVMIFLLLFMAAVYVYMSLALMKVAKRTKTEPAWLAWIPIGNLYLMSKIAKRPWWPILLLIGFIIPVLNIFATIAFYVFLMIWLYKICEARNRPGWWALLILIPGFGGIWSFVMWGILAWGKK